MGVKYMNSISDTMLLSYDLFFFFSSRRRHTRCSRDWSSDVCSSDLHESQSPAFGYGLQWSAWSACERGALVQPHLGPREAQASLHEGARAEGRVVVHEDCARLDHFRIRRRTEPPLVQPHPDAQPRGDHLADGAEQGRAAEGPAAPAPRARDVRR